MLKIQQQKISSHEMVIATQQIQLMHHTDFPTAHRNILNAWSTIRLHSCQGYIEIDIKSHHCCAIMIQLLKLPMSKTVIALSLVCSALAILSSPCLSHFFKCILKPYLQSSQIVVDIAVVVVKLG